MTARGTVPDSHARRIRRALDARAKATAELRTAVLEAADAGASVRELAKLTGLAASTISEWKRAPAVTLPPELQPESPPEPPSSGVVLNGSWAVE